MEILLTFLSIGLLFLALFHYLKNKVLRKSASYKLYAVRDELICLVAENKLSENSRIFQYYYKRVNLLLEQAPNVGLDDAMHSFLYLQSDSSFEQSLEEAERRANEMLGLIENETEEVSDIIANYYMASKCMILSHSSLVRMIYIFSVKYALNNFIKNRVNQGTCQALKIISFAEKEERQFRHVIQN